MKCVAAHLILKIPRRIKMTDTNEIHSVKDLILKNEELQARNEFLERCVEALKLNLSAVTIERNKLVDKVHFLDQKCNAYHKEVLEITSMDMWEFANLYCSEAQLEEAGHQLARSLLGGK